MATAEDLLEELLEKQLELVRARKGSEREHALEQRIDTLEAKLAERPAAEREEAIEELDDDEWELVKQHRAAKETPPPAEPEPEPEPEEEDKPKMRRGRRRGQVYQDAKGQPGYVYQGDDEPDLVPVDEEDAA